MKSPEVNDTRIQKATPEMDDDTRRALTMWKSAAAMPESIGRDVWNSAVLMC